MHEETRRQPESQEKQVMQKNSEKFVEDLDREGVERFGVGSFKFIKTEQWEYRISGSR